MELIHKFIEKAKKNPLKIVYPEGSDERIIVAACKIKKMGIAEPIIVGEYDNIKRIASQSCVSIEGVRIISPKEKIDKFSEEYAATRNVKVALAKRMVKKPVSYGGMMVI